MNNKIKELEVVEEIQFEEVSISEVEDRFALSNNACCIFIWN